MGPEDLYSRPYGGSEHGQWFYSLPAIGFEIGSVWLGPKIFNWAARGFAKREIGIAQRLRADAMRPYDDLVARNPAARYTRRYATDVAATNAQFDRNIRKAAKSTKGVAGYGKLLRRTGIGLGIYGMIQLGWDLADMFTMPGISKASLKQDQSLARDEMMLDTRSAWTQRQRALQAVHDSQLSVGRALLGRESLYLHK